MTPLMVMMATLTASMVLAVKLKVTSLNASKETFSVVVSLLTLDSHGSASPTVKGRSVSNLASC